MTTPTPSRAMAPARKKLLDTALTVIREKGYGAATVDELCQRAGTAKGSFFHHFADKQALGVAAVAYWSETTGAFFEDAPYHRHKDPLDRIMGYIEFRRALLAGDAATFSCVAGTMVQETYRTHPALRAAWRQHRRPCAHARGRHRSGHESARHSRRLDGEGPGAAHAGGAARRLRRRQGDRRRADRGLQRRSPAPLHRAPVRETTEESMINKVGESSMSKIELSRRGMAGAAALAGAALLAGEAQAAMPS